MEAVVVDARPILKFGPAYANTSRKSTAFRVYLKFIGIVR